jgi:hypothetical protein
MLIHEPTKENPHAIVKLYAVDEDGTILSSTSLSFNDVYKRGPNPLPKTVIPKEEWHKPRALLKSPSCVLSVKNQ